MFLFRSFQPPVRPPATVRSTKNLRQPTGDNELRLGFLRVVQIRDETLGRKMVDRERRERKWDASG